MFKVLLKIFQFVYWSVCPKVKYFIFAFSNITLTIMILKASLTLIYTLMFWRQDGWMSVPWAETLCHMTLVEPDILLLPLFIRANDCIVQSWPTASSSVHSKQYQIKRSHAMLLRFPTTLSNIPSTKFASTFLFSLCVLNVFLISVSVFAVAGQTCPPWITINAKIGWHYICSVKPR